jgi:putative oxidoreductase
LDAFFAPYGDVGLLILRIGLAIVFWAHGWPKLNPKSESKGVAGMAGFLKQIKIPAPVFFAWVVALLETVGMVLLVLGIGTRVIAVMLVINMIVAIVSVKIGLAKAKFSGQGGWELEFILAVAALALVFTGAGALALLP